MEAEAILHLIMKKLKEYKSNPMRSPIQEKVRQKNLQKMFSIYTTLKKKEKVQQKQKEMIERLKENGLLQEKKEEINEVLEHEGVTNITIQKQDEDIELNEYKLEDITVNNRLPESTDNLEKTENDIAMTEVDTTIHNEESQQSEQLTDAGFEDSVSPEELEPCLTIHENNQRIDNYNEEMDIKQLDYSSSVDGFLLQLGEGLKKLPYRQRSKLEIEFLARLYEVEECLGLLDD